MILTIIRCEMCSNHFRIDKQSRPYEWEVPPEWITVIEGNPQHHEGRHFCSKECLRAWIVGEKEPEA